MSDREISEALDRNSDAFQRNSEAFERNGEALERNREAFERSIDAYDRMIAAFYRFEAREESSNAFIADMVRRVEVAGQRSDAISEHMIGRLDALTDAVLRVLDRLDGGEATA